MTVRPKGNRKPYEVFQVSGSPGGVAKCHRVGINGRGEKAALKLAKAKRAEWEKTTRPWGGREARLRIDPSSVPDSIKFPGLYVCPHRAVVMATRNFNKADGEKRTIYLCYPYDVEGGSLPTFREAVDQARKGQGTLNLIPEKDMEKAWKLHKKANVHRKKGENMSNALLSFSAFNDTPGTKQEMASLCHAYDIPA